jgi:hypothetical protein
MADTRAEGSVMAARRAADRSPLGQYVTVSGDEHQRGAVYVGVRHDDDRTIRLHPVLPSDQVWRVGQPVWCTSVAGRWTSTVRAVDVGVLQLQVPEWLNRATQRRTVRVRLEHAVWLHLGEVRLAGRLRDLSLGGAAVLLERRDDLTPGREVRVTLPAGDTRATIRSARTHEHPLLRVVGISWSHLDGACSSWIGKAVAEQGRRTRAMD